LIGKLLHLSEIELHWLTLGATLHDIGKVNIPSAILDKPGKLTAEEFSIVKLHTIDGYNMLKQMEHLPEVVPLIALRHHEREDGSGYPYGLRAHDIDIYSKIVAVADIFHAMTSDRIYHKAIPFYKVIKQMQEDVFGKLNYRVANCFLVEMMNKLVNKKVVL